MTRHQGIILIVGFLLCFCLLGKQVVQDYDLTIAPPVAQNVIAENVDPDNFLDPGDDFLIMPFVLMAAFLFVIVPVFFSTRYSQPVVPSPQRPPSI